MIVYHFSEGGGARKIPPQPGVPSSDIGFLHTPGDSLWFLAPSITGFGIWFTLTPLSDFQFSKPIQKHFY